MKTKIISIYLILTLILMSLYFSGHQITIDDVSAAPNDGIDGYQEHHGDWTVTGFEQYSHETIALFGDLTVENGGHLVMINCTLLIMSLYLQPYDILLQNNATMELYDCYLTDTPSDNDEDLLSAWYHFAARAGSTLIIENSTVRQCGFLDQTNIEHFGLSIATTSGHISNTTINSTTVALAFFGNNTGFRCENITLSQIGMTAVYLFSSQGAIINGAVFNNVSERRVLHAQDSSGFRFENITLQEGDQYLGAMGSSDFIAKNIVGNQSMRVVDFYQCNNFEFRDVMIYGSGDQNSEIDIKECSYVIVDNITALDSEGTIDFEDISNVSISNIKGYNVTRFLRIQNSEYVNISGVDVDNNKEAIVLENSKNFNINNITINDTSTSIRLYTLKHSILSNVTITGLKLSNFGAVGLELWNFCENVSIIKTYIGTDSVDFSTGLLVDNSEIYVSDFKAYNTNYSIDCFEAEIYGEEIYINGSVKGDTGIRIHKADWAYLKNVTIYDQINRGIEVTDCKMGDNVRMDNVYINDTNPGVYIFNSQVIFSDLVINDTAQDMWASSTSRVTIMNSTIGYMSISDSVVTCIDTMNTTGALLTGTGRLTRKWWVDVFVEDTVGPIAGATVKIYDGMPSLEVQSTTGEDGFAWDVAVTDMIYTAPSSKEDKNPHRTDAEGPGWLAQNFTPYQVKGNIWVNVTYTKNAPPHAPTNLQAVSDENSNTILTWDPSISQDVATYNIYYATSLGNLNSYISSKIPNVTVTESSYVHVSGSEDWQKYWYAVKANDTENESISYAQGICGNWVVNKTTPQYVNNENITLKGTLHVFGNIELNDTILKIDSPSGYTFGIFINNSGNFKSENVTIMRNNTEPYYFKINPDAIVTINDSIIRRPGLNKYEGKITKKGIYSLTKNLTITNTILKIEHHGLGIYYADNFNGNLYNVTFLAYTSVQSAYLLYIYESSGVNITDCELGTYATYGIYAESSSNLNITGSKIEVACYTDAFWGIYMDDCSHSKIYNNIEIKGRPAIFFKDSLNISIEVTKIVAHNSICIQGESSLLTTIRDCDFDEPDERSDISIYMSGCRASTIIDMAINNQKEPLRLEDESWSIIKNLTLGGGDLGIRLINSNNIYINDTYITFIQTGMIVIGCRDIYFFNTVINLTFYCLDIYSPGPVNLYNCTIENGIGSELTAEGYEGEQGEINLINSTINSLSDNSLWLNNSGVVSLINTTFDLTKLRIDDFSSRVEVFHYTSIQVYDIDNNIPALANITIFNAKDQMVYKKEVNNGLAQWILIHQKTIFKLDEFSDNPHRIYFNDGWHYGNLETNITASGHLNVYVSNIEPWMAWVDIKGFYDAQPPDNDIESYEPTTEFDINLTYMYQDLENDPESGTIIHWYVNGVHNSSFDGMLIINAQYTSKYQTWEAVVYPSDGYDSTFPTYPFQSNVLYIINTAPEVSNVTVSPTNPISGNSLSVDYDLYDVDGDGLDSSKTTHKWHYHNVTSGLWDYSNIDSATLPSSYTSKGQRWRCHVTPNDGDDDGTMVISSEVTVGNTAPSATNLIITPEEPMSDQNLQAIYTFNDVDQDLENGSIIKWFKNGEEQSNLNGSLEVDSNLTKKDEEWYYKVLPNDGIIFGAEVQSESVIIQNTPPRILNITILPSNPSTEDDLTVEYEFYDDDGDGESFDTIVEWLKWSGVEFTHTGLRVQTLSSVYISKNEIWTCEITPHDDFTYGDTVRSTESVTILNSAPTVSDLHITPTEPTTTSDLMANYEYDDLDNDPESDSQIVWYCYDTEMTALQNSLTVSHNLTAKGQTWYFTIRPSDGTAYGITVESDVITIQNSAPKALNLTITPRFPLGDDELVASYKYIDEDGDDESAPEIRWYKNIWVQEFYNDNLTVESTATEKGEIWYFSIRVFDGFDYSEVTNSHYVAIENSKPIINTITPEPGTIIINEEDSIDFSVEATDPDGDLLLIKWRLDKTTVSDSEYYLFDTDYKSNGSYDLNLTIQDVGKNSFTLSHIWKIIVQNTNREPEIEVREPLVKDPKVIEDTPLKFLIDESDPDGDDDTLTINWFIDGVSAQVSGASFSYTPRHADVGERIVSVILSDGTDTDEYSWNVTVEPKQVKEDEKGPLGLDWDVWGILMEIIVVSATGILAFIGYRRLRKKKGALKIYMDEIEEISKLKDKDPEKYETKLNDLEERINTEFREGKLEDLHFLMIQELIASKRGEHRRETVSRKFRSLPQGIAKNLDEMLEDGKISRDEYMAFATTMKESKSLTPFEKRELSKMISKWEVEDKGTVPEDSLTKKLKPKEKVEMAEWEDDDEDLDEE